MVRKHPVTKQEPCPICGKLDFCWWKEREDHTGYFNLYCNRISEAKGTIVTGLDGNEYMAVFEKNPGTIFQNKAEREEMFGKEMKGGKRKKAEEKRYLVVDAVEVLDHESLDQVYRSLMSILPLYPFHASYLMKEGWSLDLLKKHQICSMPPGRYDQMVTELQKYYMSRESMAKEVMKITGRKNLKGVPGAFQEKTGEWTFLSKSGILFPVYDEDGLIYRLRLRMDYMDLPKRIYSAQSGFYYKEGVEKVQVTMGGPVKIGSDGEKIKVQFDSHQGKYRPLTSYKMDQEAYSKGMIENVYINGCEAGNVLGWAMSTGDDRSVFWITEGEKKGLYANSILKQPVLLLPGVTSYKLVEKKRGGLTPLDHLKHNGAKVAVIAFDADKETNQMVRKSQDELGKILKANGFKVFSAEWNINNGKGIDDLLSHGILPSFKVL